MQIQSYELENLEAIALDRNEKIEHLVRSINQLNELFKQMNRLVIEQVFQKTVKGKEELIQVI